MFYASPQQGRGPGPRGTSARAGIIHRNSLTHVLWRQTRRGPENRRQSMKTKAQAAAIFALAGALISVRGQAAVQTTPVPAAVPALSATEQKIQDIKNPFPWMSWGGDLRIRNEYFNDLLTLSEKNPLHEQDYFRFRSRVFTSITPVDDLSLNARLTAEPREWMKPAGYTCLLYTSPSPRDRTRSRMPSSA